MTNKTKLPFDSFMLNFENNSVKKKLTNIDFFNISCTKIYLNIICNSNKRLMILNEELKYTSATDWVANAKLSNILKIHLKILLKKIICNKLKINRKQIKLRNNLRNRIAKKSKSYTLHSTYLLNKKQYIDTKIDIWMKEHQNEILEEKINKKLKMDADIILTDVRIKRLIAKKSLFILQELSHYRKLKVDVSRTSSNLLPTEASDVIHNIFTNLIYQWKTLSREYCFEEKGLKLMMETDNVNKALKHTKNVFYNWETYLFKNKISLACQLEETNNFSTLRALWDTFLEDEGNEIPTGWIVPCSLNSDGWMKYRQ